MKEVDDIEQLTVFWKRIRMKVELLLLLLTNIGDTARLKPADKRLSNANHSSRVSITQSKDIEDKAGLECTPEKFELRFLYCSK